MYTYENLFVNKIYDELLRFENNDPDTRLKINIVLTNDCNQKCSYCVAKSNKVKKEDVYYIDKKYIIMLFKYLKYINFNRDFRVNLLGGEPTMHPELENIISIISNIYPDKTIKFFTNGSQSIDYYKNLISKYKLYSYISYHPKFADTNHYIDIINAFRNENYLIVIVLEYDYYDKIFDFINKAKDINGNIYFVLLDGIDYVNTKYNIFKDIINDLKDDHESTVYKLTFENKELILPYKDIAYYNSTNTNIFKGMYCDIYDSQWVIYKNEISTLCNSKQSYKIYNMSKFMNDYESYKNGVLCNIDKCISDCLIEPCKHKYID